VADFLRKLFGRQQAPHPSDEDADLVQFYTNNEHALQVFEQLVTATTLPKRLLVIHGIGGVGKSTLLKMYALSCRSHHIPVAIVASEETPSPVDVLADWAENLSHDSVKLPIFQKTLDHYRAIQAKVETEATKTNQATSQLTSNLGKAAAKAAVGMALSAIPIVGPLASALGGESTEAFVNWLHGFLSKPDLDLYLDPAGRLTGDFLSDLAHAASQERMVLMTDTYEQMTALDDWMRELVRRLPKNVLMVIASRTVPEWNRAWQEWMGKAEIVELKEMTPDELRTLVHRYYAYIRSGDPDPKQVEAIVQFARGLPMVATTVVQLWVKYGAEDFQTVRPQVVADLADRLLEGVPQVMRPAFEAAAVLRYFNVEILGTVLENSDAEKLYAELRRWPFIRSRREGLAVHDTMREMINEALQVRTPERFRMLHERAAVYYEVRLEKATGDERDRYAAERLYHRVCAEEVSGVQLFQEQAEELTCYRMTNRLRALLNDVNTYSLEQENSQLWREYYKAHLAHLEGRTSQAEEVYQAIGENERVEPKLRAYALCDWGEILRRREPLYQPDRKEKAIYVLESSLLMGGTTDVKLAMSWLYLSYIYASKANWEKALFYLDQARRFFSERNDYSGLLNVLDYERGIYWRQGNLCQTFDIERQMRNFYTLAGELPYLRTRIPPTWEWAWAGRYAEAEKEFREVLEVARSLQDQHALCRRTRELALYLGLQGKCAEALVAAEEGLSLARSFESAVEMEVLVALLLYGYTCLKCGKLDRSEEYLVQVIVTEQKLHAHREIGLLYLATLYEVLKRFDQAEYFHQLAQTEAHSLGRNYVESGALAGLMRIKHAQKDFSAIPPLWTEAERIAQQYEYNDYFTSLYLTRGHITWVGLISEWGSGFDSVLYYYQLALIHALRFNRFLLDEALSGREQGTPLQPIVPHCLERGEEGQRMLVALRDWWQGGINDVGMPRPDTISPIPEGIPLLEAERIARKREPGDGSMQKDVVEQIEAALTMANGEERLSP
jgi:ATP/maltotriose-dependent transcriptional regulator MalT